MYKPSLKWEHLTDQETFFRVSAIERFHCNSNNSWHTCVGSVIRLNSTGATSFQDSRASSDPHAYQGYSITSGRFMTPNRQGRPVSVLANLTKTHVTVNLNCNRFYGLLAKKKSLFWICECYN